MWKPQFAILLLCLFFAPLLFDVVTEYLPLRNGFLALLMQPWSLPALILAEEIIDLFAVLDALRLARAPTRVTEY